MYLSIARLFEEADVEPESANANSSDSGLLKLSAELRLLIYKYVFQGEVIHLSKSKTGHKSVICPKIKCRTCDRRTQCPLYRSREENVDPTGGDAGNNNPTQDGAQGTVFSILQTCQQIYNEASHVMDSTVTFDVAYMAVWILFCQTFPRGRLARIRRFQIHYWTGYIPGTDKHPANAQYCEFWGLVAFCMPALRHLHFCMDFTSLNRLGALYMDFDKRWPNWAIPILYVRGLLSCELTVNVNFNAALDMISVDEYRDLVPLRRDCLEEMKRIMCRQVDRQKVDLSDLFLGHAFPQGDRDGLRALLKKRYVTMIPRNLERRVRISVVSIGILRSELYQPDSIPAHRDNPDLTRKRADGNLYVNDIIEWLVQKGDELPITRRIMMERVARKQKHLFKAGHNLEIYTSDTTMESHYGKDHPKNQGALHSASKPIRVSKLRSYRVQQTVGQPGSESEEIQIRKTWFKLPYEVVFRYNGYDISVSAFLSLDWYIHTGASPLAFELREPLDWASMGIPEDRLLSI